MAQRYRRKYHRSALAGLLTCGVCGSGRAKHDNANGRQRIRCSRAPGSMDCGNRRRAASAFGRTAKSDPERRSAGLVSATRAVAKSRALLALFDLYAFAIRAFRHSARHLRNSRKASRNEHSQHHGMVDLSRNRVQPPRPEKWQRTRRARKFSFFNSSNRLDRPLRSPYARQPTTHSARHRRLSRAIRDRMGGQASRR